MVTNLVPLLPWQCHRGVQWPSTVKRKTDKIKPGIDYKQLQTVTNSYKRLQVNPSQSIVALLPFSDSSYQFPTLLSHSCASSPRASTAALPQKSAKLYKLYRQVQKSKTASKKTASPGYAFCKSARVYQLTKVVCKRCTLTELLLHIGHLSQAGMAPFAPLYPRLDKRDTKRFKCLRV